MFSLYIAKRYLLTKKSNNAINIISFISVCGVAVATAALICILSVFNGFQDMVANLFTAIDPELKITPAEGKFFSTDSPELKEVKNNQWVEVCTEVLEDNALVMINNRQTMAVVKGVEKNFDQLIDFDKIRFGTGEFQLQAASLDYGIPGINLLSTLGIGADFKEPITVYAPRGGEKIDLSDPTESFNEEELFSTNLAFCVKQAKYDANYVLTSIDFARRLFEKEDMVSALELKISGGEKNVDIAKKELQSILGNKYVIKDRYEQQEETFSIMQIEKLISYIFLTFIILIACFNIIGSLSMLIIDKKNDLITLKNLGAEEKQIARIFMIEGQLISIVGAIIGLIVGLLLCWIQQTFGVIKFGEGAGNYIIDAYPVSIHFIDVILVLITVIIVGVLAVWYPVKRTVADNVKVMEG